MTMVMKRTRVKEGQGCTDLVLPPIVRRDVAARRARNHFFFFQVILLTRIRVSFGVGFRPRCDYGTHLSAIGQMKRFCFHMTTDLGEIPIQGAIIEWIQLYSDHVFAPGERKALEY